MKETKDKMRGIGKGNYFLLDLAGSRDALKFEFFIGKGVRVFS